MATADGFLRQKMRRNEDEFSKNDEELLWSAMVLRVHAFDWDRLRLGEFFPEPPV